MCFEKTYTAKDFRNMADDVLASVTILNGWGWGINRSRSRLAMQKVGAAMLAMATRIEDLENRLKRLEAQG